MLAFDSANGVQSKKKDADTADGCALPKVGFIEELNLYPYAIVANEIRFLAKSGKNVSIHSNVENCIRS